MIEMKQYVLWGLNMVDFVIHCFLFQWWYKYMFLIRLLWLIIIAKSGDQNYLFILFSKARGPLNFQSFLLTVKFEMYITI